MKKRSLLEKILKATMMLAFMAGVTMFYSCDDDDEPELKAEITGFTVVDAGVDQSTSVEGSIEGTEITVAVPYETDISALTPEIEVSTGAQVTPESGTTLDFSETRSFVVENEDLQTTYEVSVTRADPEGAVLKSLEVASANTGEEYDVELDHQNDEVLVTFNELQSELVTIVSIEVGPEGATYETSSETDTLDLASEPAIDVAYAGETRTYSLVSEITSAGFDVSTAEVLIDKSAASQAVPSEIADENSRGADFDGRYVFVPSRLNGTFMHYWDLEASVDEAQNLSMEGVEGGSWEISDVKCAADAIYASNMVMAEEGVEFKVYKWDDVDADPEVVLSYATTSDEQRLGDALSIVGDPSDDGKIIASNFPGWGGKADNNEFFVFEADNGEFGDPVVWDLALEETDNVGQYGRINEVPGEDNMFVASGAEMGITLLDGNGEVLYEVPESVIQFRAYDPHIFEYNGGRYLSYTINREWEANGAFSQIVNITEGEDIKQALQSLSDDNIDDKLVYTNEFAGSDADPWINANNAVVKDEEGDPMVFSFTSINGFVVEKFTR